MPNRITELTDTRSQGRPRDVAPTSKGIPSETIDQLVVGSIDMHAHAGPDGLSQRRASAIMVVRAASEAQMSALVLKNKRSGTGSMALVLNELFPSTQSVGALTLDLHVGGLNSEAVQAEARLGARVVWMPTHQALNDRKFRQAEVASAIRVTDDLGNTLPDLTKVLDTAANYDMLVCTGHLSRDEVFTVVRECRDRELRVVVTHPLQPVTHLSLDEQCRLADMGAIMEYTMASMMPSQADLPLSMIVDAIRRVGPARSIVSTDFGQSHNPLPSEGMRMAAGMLLTAGMPTDDVHSLICDVPMGLLCAR